MPSIGSVTITPSIVYCGAQFVISVAVTDPYTWLLENSDNFLVDTNGVYLLEQTPSAGTHSIPYSGSQIDDAIGTFLGQGFCTCSTEAATTAKTASLTGYVLEKGGAVAVQFQNAVPANATLSINSQTAKPIYYQGSAITAGVISAGDTATFIYDGTNYNLLFLDGGGA